MEFNDNSTGKNLNEVTMIPALTKENLQNEELEREKRILAEEKRVEKEEKSIPTLSQSTQTIANKAYDLIEDKLFTITLLLVIDIFDKLDKTNSSTWTYYKPVSKSKGFLKSGNRWTYSIKFSDNSKIKIVTKQLVNDYVLTEIEIVK